MIKYLLVLSLIFVMGCAAGAATAGYSLHAKTAEDVSTSCKQSIVQEVKEEIIAYLKTRGVIE